MLTWLSMLWNNFFLCCCFDYFHLRKKKNRQYSFAQVIFQKWALKLDGLSTLHKRCTDLTQEHFSERSSNTSETTRHPYALYSLFHQVSHMSMRAEKIERSKETRLKDRHNIGYSAWGWRICRLTLEGKYWAVSLWWVEKWRKAPFCSRNIPWKWVIKTQILK